MEMNTHKKTWSVNDCFDTKPDVWLLQNFDFIGLQNPGRT